MGGGWGANPPGAKREVSKASLQLPGGGGAGRERGSPSRAASPYTAPPCTHSFIHRSNHSFIHSFMSTGAFIHKQVPTPYSSCIRFLPAPSPWGNPSSALL